MYSWACIFDLNVLYAYVYNIYIYIYIYIYIFEGVCLTPVVLATVRGEGRLRAAGRYVVSTGSAGSRHEPIGVRICCYVFYTYICICNMLLMSAISRYVLLCCTCWTLISQYFLICSKCWTVMYYTHVHIYFPNYPGNIYIYIHTDCNHIQKCPEY